MASRTVTRRSVASDIAALLDSPEVSALIAELDGLNWTGQMGYGARALVGACLGSIVANLMFELPVVEWSTKTRSSGALWLSEVVATVGLLLVIHGCVRTGRASVVPFAVGIWIGGAYWFTSSTSFANPAVTIARSLSNTFSGIAPAGVLAFILARLVGMAAAVALSRWLWRA